IPVFPIAWSHGAADALRSPPAAIRGTHCFTDTGEHMNRSHSWLMAAGALVLAITNAVVLMDVAFNRRQPPDSTLELTDRELAPQRSWMWREDENSGLGLRLQYRVELSRSSN